MNDLGDAEYVRGRETVERTMAERAADRRVARIHLTLADRYALQANAASAPLMSVAAS